MSILSDGNELSRLTSAGEARSGRRRELINRIFFVACLIITSIAIVALTVLLVTIAVEGWEGLTPEFLNNYGSRKPESAGVKAALWGSIWICCVCGIVALPIGVGTAIYLEEFAAKNRFTSFIRTNISNLAGVPSIVYGIIGLTIFARMFGLPGIGTETSPGLTVGSTWYDTFYDAEGGRMMRKVPSREAPDLPLETGQAALFINELDISQVADVALPAQIVADDATGFTVVIAPEAIEITVEETAATQNLPGMLGESSAMNPRPWNDTIALLTSDRTLNEKTLKDAPTRTSRWLEGTDALGNDLIVPVPQGRNSIITGDTGYRLRAVLPRITRSEASAESAPERIDVRYGDSGRVVTGKTWREYRVAGKRPTRYVLQQLTPGVEEEPLVNWVLVDPKYRNEFVEVGREHVLANVVSDDADTSRSARGTVFASDAAEPLKGERIERRSWYYFQLPFGKGVFAGGLTLMLVILPVVIIASVEALRAVPNSLRQASLAMGATQWQTVRQVTLPASIPMIMTGSILAMSRAIGEAAPILVLGVALFITRTPENLMDQFTILPMQIYNWAGRPGDSFQQLAASGIIILLVVLLTFNAAAILIRHRLQKTLK